MPFSELLIEQAEELITVSVVIWHNMIYIQLANQGAINMAEHLLLTKASLGSANKCSKKQALPNSLILAFLMYNIKYNIMPSDPYLMNSYSYVMYLGVQCVFKRNCVLNSVYLTTYLKQLLFFLRFLHLCL